MSGSDVPLDVQQAITTIAISDDSSDSNSNYGGTSSTSDSTQKGMKRQIAVKKGHPVNAMPGAHRFQRKDPTAPQVAQIPKYKKDKTLLASTEFLSDFNPEQSKREKNKQKIYCKPKVKKGNTSMYDDQGLLRMTKEDVCDCLESDCPGCHFPCLSCGSEKCGIRCRVNRKWAYEMIEYDGKEIRKTNPFIQTINYANNFKY